MRKFIFILIIALIFLSGCGVMEEFEEAVDITDETEYLVTIPKGASTTSIAKLLVEYEMIYNEFVFKTKVKELEYDGKLKAGDYKLSKSYDLEKIIKKLYDGDVYIETIQFTIPEGLELDEIVDVLLKENIIENREIFLDVYKQEMANYELINNLDIVNYEGFLFPDTYVLKKGATDKEIVKIMLDRFVKLFDEETVKYISDNDLDLYELIVLASIIEREIMVADEQVIASSVFHNRLDISMKLQSCATVQYVIAERKALLTNKDIAIDNEYNTYKYLGLPPGPICSPGEGSIRAAIYPADTDFLYFVRSYKNDNSHIFSTNLADHNKAKQKLYKENN
ncbi:MAG: endolytic transglycosylase MltG [Bacillota bacterium]|nr:endolytic transglycosylase MltG [Bacillota bacterium]